MPSIAERLALVEQIQRQVYPQHDGAWLKAVAVAPLLRREKKAAADAREILETFLECELFNWLPEDSAYATFTDGEWRQVDRDELLRCVDTIFARAAESIAEIRAEEAAERAEAEAGGYLHAIGRSQLERVMIDLDALRRWFSDELWGAAAPTWFTNMGPDFHDEPAVIGVDDDVLALLWAP